MTRKVRINFSALVSSILVIILITIITFLYLDMRSHQTVYIASEAAYQKQLIAGYRNVSLGLSSTILDYDNDLKYHTKEIPQTKNKTGICFSKLLISPLNKAIIIGDDTIYDSPDKFFDNNFQLNLEKKIVPDIKNINGSEIFIADFITCVAPVNNLFTNFDTIKLLIDIKSLVEDLNKLDHGCYRYLDNNAINNLRHEKIIQPGEMNTIFQEPEECDQTYLQIQQSLSKGFKTENFFHKYYKWNGQNYALLFIPVVNWNYKSEGLIVVSIPDKFYSGFFNNFVVYSIGCVIIFLLIIILIPFFLRSKNLKKRRNSGKDEPGLISQRNTRDFENEPGLNHKTLGLLTHELRTPINAIQGFTDLLSEKITQPDQLQYIIAIKKSTENLLAYINNIIDASKIETGEFKTHPEPLNLRLLLHEVKDILKERLENKTTDLELSISKDIPEIIIFDEARIKQVLISLINHALLIMQKGVVLASFSAVEIDETLEKLDLQITISHLTDKTSKINNSDSSDIKFNSNYLNEKPGNISTDMYFTGKLLPLLNGEMQYRNDPADGLTITCKFKGIEYVQEEFQMPKLQTPKLSNVTFGPCKILVVDDVSQNRFLIRELVKKTSITYLEAQNGKQAVELAIEHIPDLILMDIRMPLMDGVEATKILRQHESLNDTIIVALTASVGDDEINEIRRSGFEDILKKPIKLKKLIRLLLTYLPHTIDDEISQKTSPQKDQSFKGNQPTGEQNGLILEMENELHDEWKNVKSSGFISEISNFGKLIFETGKKYASKELMEYGESVLVAAERFDVTGMKNILNTYDDLIKKIKGENIP